MKKVDVQVDPSLLKELVIGDKIFRSTCDFHVTDRDLEKARKELKETEETRRICLEELKKLLSKDRRMRYRLDDDYLLRFLRYRKFDVQKTYKFIQHFYTTRNENPLLFTLPPDVEFTLDRNFCYLLPYTNDNGEMVYLYRFDYWNPSELSMRDYCTFFSYASDVGSMNPHAQIDGAIIIFDFGRTSARLLSQLLYPPDMKLFLLMTQEMYPWKAKKIILFNCSAVLYGIIYVFRLFFKKKLFDRTVLIHSDVKELHKHVNSAILPKEYGGNLDDEECSSYLKKVILSNKEYLRYENSFIGYNE